MTNKITKILLSVFIFLTTFTYSQTNTGIIIYKGTLNQKHIDSVLKDMDTKDIPMSHKKFSIVHIIMLQTSILY